MKIAISSDGNNLESNVDPRFGRCPFFLIVELDSNNFQIINVMKNEGESQNQGAGIRTAQQISELNVEFVISGQIGPNASKILNELGIKQYCASGIIKNVLNDFVKNEFIQKNSSSKSTFLNVEKNDELDEKIFFPLQNNDNFDSIISEHFGHAPYFGVYYVKSKKLEIIPNDLNHVDQTKSPIDQIQESVNPTTIFAKGIGGRAINIIKQKGLSLKTGNYTYLKQVIENLDKLEDQTSDCGHTH
jgi:predicted Fe-Mo cluster-binding NifX family protein